MSPDLRLPQSGASHPPKSTTISIAMCTYNGARFLKEQLESFLKQSRLPDQLMVCDDASTDATRAILTEFAAAAPFQVDLRYNTSTRGVAKNFEQALLACQGDFVVLCDQDDRWHSTKMQRLSELLESNPQAGFACSNAALIDDKGRTMSRSLWGAWRIDPPRLAGQSPEARRAYLVRSNCMTGATMMFRRQVLWEYLAPIPVSWVHDHWLAVLCEILSRPGCATTDLLTEYRLHAGQTIGIAKRRWFRGRQTTDARARKLQQRRQRYLDLQSHLDLVIVPRVPEAAVWLDAIRDAHRELDERQHEVSLPWWQRGWHQFLRRQRRAA